MTDKRIQPVVNWAKKVQGLSAETVELTNSACSVIEGSDLASNTTQSNNLAFETEPSAFIKLLHDLAVAHDK